MNICRCRCGQVYGERCAWTGSLSDMVVVEFMPAFLRASHEAAGGNGGSYPANGAERIAVEHSCAECILETEEGWAKIVSADPAEYIDA